MSVLIDVSGQTFAKLTVIARVPPRGKSRYAFWLCLCECGNTAIVQSRWLRNGRIKSCGCHRRRLHGFSGTHIYDIWRGMRSRCGDERCAMYYRYGGRGIALCSEWKNDFLTFRSWAITNGYKPGLSIDRIDNDGNYEPSNCRFLTISENSKRKGKYWGKNKRPV